MKYRDFAKELKQSLSELKSEKLRDPHPSPEVVVAYVQGELDEETSRHVRMHTLFCHECLAEIMAVREVVKADAQSMTVSWRELIEKLKAFVIDLNKTYGPGALFGSVRLVAEQPVFALRGGEETERIFKVLEMPLGDNTYSIELAVTDQGSVSFDIAGSRTSLKAPLGIVVRSETGDELVSTQSDEFGNSRFVVPSVPDDLLVFTLKLGDAEQSLLLRVPGKQRPA